MTKVNCEFSESKKLLVLSERENCQSRKRKNVSIEIDSKKIVNTEEKIFFFLQDIFTSIFIHEARDLQVYHHILNVTALLKLHFFFLKALLILQKLLF